MLRNIFTVSTQDASTIFAYEGYLLFFFFYLSGVEIVYHSTIYHSDNPTRKISQTDSIPPDKIPLDYFQPDNIPPVNMTISHSDIIQPIIPLDKLSEFWTK